MTDEIKKRILILRMERQYLSRKANEKEYLELYRDTQPGQNEYWHGFGQPPVMAFRADFDDIEWNRARQEKRELVKGRFQGGNLGWIMEEDMELFACLCRKPLDGITYRQNLILNAIEQLGPLNIQQMKEETGMLVKEITPVLHRMQEAFILYEDQYDGEWDRSWYRFEEMLPKVNLEKYTRIEAFKIILKRFAYRMVWFDVNMAKSFYKLPAKDIKIAVKEMVAEEELYEYEGGFISTEDYEYITSESSNILQEFTGEAGKILVMHRNDVLVKAFEHEWKSRYKPYIINAKEKFPEATDFEILWLLIMDGEIHGAVLGKFKYGPYMIEDIVVDEGYEDYREEILKAVRKASPESKIERFMGEEIKEQI